MSTKRPDQFITGFADRSYDKLIYHTQKHEEEEDKKEAASK